MRSVGYRMAQLGGLLMIVGGMVDLSVRELLPHHTAALGLEAASAPEEAQRLVLALLRALGGALVASGLAVLVLLRSGRQSRNRLPFVAAGLVALLAEGPNAWGIMTMGSTLYLAPLSFMLLVIVGTATCLLPHSRRKVGRLPPTVMSSTEV